MNFILKIALLLLFVSLHLDINGLFIESYSVFYISFFVVVSIVTIQQNSNNLKVNPGYIVFVLLFISYLLRFFIQGNIYGIHRIYPILACSLLFFVFSMIFSKDRHSIKLVLGLIVISVVLELILGYGQLFGWIGNKNTNFILGGSFGNPGAYAGYLGAVTPLLLSLLLSYGRIKKAENLYYGLMACFILLLFILFKSESRGAWLASILGCIIVLNYKYLWVNRIIKFMNTTFRRVSVIMCIILFLITTGFILYNYKANSAFGRVLVWKVTTFTPHQSLLSGNGIGFFEANYGKWQASYFANEKGSEMEQYVADYVTCPYNEFIEIGIEQGVIILLLLLILFLLVFKQKNNTNSSLLLGAKASIAAILMLMCVSYPLQNISIFLYLILCLAVVFFPKQDKNEKIYSVRRILIKLICLFIGLLITIGAFINLYGYYQLRKGQQYVFSNQFDKGLEAYDKAETSLKNNGLYQFYYGSALTLKEQYEEGISRLEMSIQKTSNPNSYILLGNNYKEVGENQRAEEAYLMVINMIPSRLYPKYLLAKLYIDTSEYEKAQKMALEILDTKEKVSTTAAREMKNEMELFINSLKK